MARTGANPRESGARAATLHCHSRRVDAWASWKSRLESAPNSATSNRLSAMAATIPYPDRVHLQFARGWLELGCLGEAEKELGCLRPEAAGSSEGMEVRFQLLVKERRFSEALPMARDQRRRFPREVRWLMNVGNVLFWLGRADEAVDVVLPALEDNPGEAVLLYNLACYYVSLGDLAAAKRRLQDAMRAGDRRRVMRHALADDDLRALWPWIQSLDPGAGTSE